MDINHQRMFLELNREGSLEQTRVVPGTNLPYFSGTYSRVSAVLGEFVDDGFGDYPAGSTYTLANKPNHSPDDFNC